MIILNASIFINNISKIESFLEAIEKEKSKEKNPKKKELKEE